MEPGVIHNTTIRFKPLKEVKQIKLVKSGTMIKFKHPDGWIECTVPSIWDYEMILCLTID